MKQYSFILKMAIPFIMMACSPDHPEIKDNTLTKDQEPVADKQIVVKEHIRKLSYDSLNEIASGSYSDWVDTNSVSLALHFMDDDTLAVSYSVECWLHYPYELCGDKIVVYWDDLH